MITQALYQRYLTMIEDSDSGMAPPGYSTDKVSYALELAEDGTPLRILNIRDISGKKPLAVSVNVPEHGVRSSGIKPYFLSDKAEYILGLTVDKTGMRISSHKKFQASKEMHQSLLAECVIPEARAVWNYFENWNPAELERNDLLKRMIDEVLASTDTNFIFSVEGSSYRYVHDHPEIRQVWARAQNVKRTDAVYGTCLITGEPDRPLARTHEIKIKGVADAQSMGVSLVSFNFPSAQSYGKEQAYNASVSEEAAVGYAKALNQLLASRSNRLRGVGDMTIVFWAERNVTANHNWELQEGVFADFFNDFWGSDDTEGNQAVTSQIRDIIHRLRQGKGIEREMLPDDHASFYLLGVSPNAGRLAVRYFWKDSFDSLMGKLALHASDMAIGRPYESSPEIPGLFQVMRETVHANMDSAKMKKATATMAAAWFRSIIQGQAYPYAVYAAILGRIRIDGRISPYGDSANSAWVRVSVIKAYLTRYARIYNDTKLKEALRVDANHEVSEESVAYRLGRVFAVLERVQAEAAGGYGKLNRTIKDSYFSSASTTPAAVFPYLIRRAQSHISKIDYGFYRNQEMAGLLKGITQFPSQLNMHEQGQFVLGYYEQAQVPSASKSVASAKAKTSPSPQEKGENEQ
ncbi:CRISPR-associated protein [compost metagenome]